MELAVGLPEAKETVLLELNLDAAAEEELAREITCRQRRDRDTNAVNNLGFKAVQIHGASFQSKFSARPLSSSVFRLLRIYGHPLLILG